MKAPQTQKQLITRLCRIEGQVRGVQRMIDGDANCQDVLIQLSAIRAALRAVSVEVARLYAYQCLAESRGAEYGDGGQEVQAIPGDLIDQLLSMLSKI